MREHRQTFIIAEAGVNHNGSVALARQLIDVAVEAEADAVKFQTFIASKSVTRQAPKADYQKETTGSVESQLEMARKLELDAEAHKILYRYCQEQKIQFLSTPFDLESIDLLDELGLEILKIPSGEIVNLPYLRKIGGLKKKLILSTGMADLREIEDALAVLIAAGTTRENLTILHCNSAYPSPYEDVNLRAILTIKAAFPGIPAGYSDHTPGIEIPVAAVAIGATVIEKHFTLDRNMAGPDHRASLEPAELKAMVRAIRNVEKALGDGRKLPSPSERGNKLIGRKSIVAARYIQSGEVFTPENLTTKRPGTGICPMEWDRVIGRSAQQDFEEDALIEI